MQAVVNTLEEQEIYLGSELHVEVARRDAVSRIFEI